MFILEKAHVATVTGEAFGSPNNIRISYAASRENIKKAVDRIKVFSRFCQKYGENIIKKVKVPTYQLTSKMNTKF